MQALPHGYVFSNNYAACLLLHWYNRYLHTYVLCQYILLKACFLSSLLGGSSSSLYIHFLKRLIFSAHQWHSTGVLPVLSAVLHTQHPQGTKLLLFSQYADCFLVFLMHSKYPEMAHLSLPSFRCSFQHLTASFLNSSAYCVAMIHSLAYSLLYIYVKNSSRPTCTIKVIKRNAFGYRNFENFRNRIFLSLT